MIEGFFYYCLVFVAACAIILSPFILHAFLFEYWRWYRSYWMDYMAKSIVLERLGSRDEALFKGDSFNILIEEEKERLK